jgi:hypothetical protein
MKQTPTGKMFHSQYKEGEYYDDRGLYLGIRKTYTSDRTIKTEHIFTNGKEWDGTAILNRILISEKPQQWL